MSAVTRATNRSDSSPPSAAVERKSSTSKNKPENGNQISDTELHKTIDTFKTQIMVAAKKYPDTDLADQLSFNRDKFLQQVREKAVEQKNWDRVSLINKIFLDISPNHFLLRSPSQNEAKNGDHVSDAELSQTLIRFNSLIRVAAEKFSGSNLANQLAEDRDDFLHLVREKAVKQKNWNRELFVNKIFLEITTNHFIRLIKLKYIGQLKYLLYTDNLCISPKVLDVASESPAIQEIFISNLKESTHLIRAAERGLNDCVNLSLQHEADPNMKNAIGITALHYAATKGRPEVIRTLLDNKADPNIADAKGITPLICALESGCKESQNLLLPFTNMDDLFTNPNLKVEVLDQEEYNRQLDLRDPQLPPTTLDFPLPYNFLPPQRKE